MISQAITTLEDDGLSMDEPVGSWAVDKYRLVSTYCAMFSTGMKNAWDCRVYVDLFAGCGRSKLKETGEIISASPMLSLQCRDPFDRYIFCEQREDLISSLEKRTKRDFPDAITTFIYGDVNMNADRIIKAIPRGRRDFKVLSFCFVDPFGASALKFNTIRTLSKYYVDFLILIPTGMDFRRNESRYIQEGDTTVSEFLGQPNWRAQWKQESVRNVGFGAFVADAFGKQMKTLGYIYTGPDNMIEVKGTPSHLSLYHFAFFSRDDKRGMKFWAEARKYSRDQLEMF